MKRAHYQLKPPGVGRARQLYSALYCLGFTITPISADGAAHVTGDGVDFVTHALSPLYLPGGPKSTHPRRSVAKRRRGD